MNLVGAARAAHVAARSSLPAGDPDRFDAPGASRAGFVSIVSGPTPTHGPSYFVTGIRRMVLMIDNYDSFTYNLVQYLGELGAEVRVVYNDAIDIATIEASAPSHIVISPGPKAPADAGISLDIVGRFRGRIPILGVCLGHQCIGQAYGARIVHAGQVMHGKTSAIHHRGTDVFSALPSPVIATRYHSLVIDPATLPAEVEITAWTEAEDGRFDEIMGVCHRQARLYGVQFHPESILTEHGHALLGNFLRAG
jgi:anthranilate synthase component 2